MTAKRLLREKAVKALLSLAGLALFGVALQSLVFSDASYTAGSGNRRQLRSLAGSLSHSNSKEWSRSSWPLDRPAPAVPAKSGTLSITGDGDARRRLTP